MPRIVLHHLHNAAGCVGVFTVVTGNYDQLWTAALGLPHGHAGLDAKCPGFVGGGGDDSAVAGTGYGDGLTPQFRIDLLFNRGKEGVHVYAHDDTFAHVSLRG